MSSQQIIELARGSGIGGWTVSSTFRPGDITASGNLSWHASNHAVDFGGFNQDAFAAWWGGVAAQYGVRELIHRTDTRDYAILRGEWASSPVGSIINPILAKGTDWIMDEIMNPVFDRFSGYTPDSNWLGNFSRGGSLPSKHFREKAREEVDKAVQAQMAMSVAGPQPVAAWAPLVLQAMDMVGFDKGQLGKFLALMQAESGGDPNAVNNYDSNAARGMPSMGLMQVIRPTFEAHKFPGYNNQLAPLDNILASLRYIQARYGGRVPGSPYDEGGILPTGTTLAVNNTGRPEYVLTQSQWDSMSNESGGVHVTKVYIDGKELEQYKVVEEFASSLTRALRR
jgi:hypothetical protein